VRCVALQPSRLVFHPCNGVADDHRERILARPRLKFLPDKAAELDARRF
jgi:hypothetical protein